MSKSCCCAATGNTAGAANVSSTVRVYEEEVKFKTYLTGKQDQHPIFLEHRVYQGSSGAVYPYGVTDTLQDRAEERTYNALYLENDYLKIMILPELGGRVHRAYDKVNQRDFVYFNHVVKPALVGLLGPWISGGIEFNWPQHHRPTTFMPVDYCLKQNDDGSASVIVGEREPMHGLTITTAFTLFPDKALLQISSKVFNGNDTPRSFLWWSNPAVKGGDGHQSIFPPDVTAVFDHGKRAVIDFPIAHGEYYKVKYDGVDISRYQNLPVPTSYMAWRSDYDFVGAYCHDEEGGLLHIADHHVSPGKKQWSWGYGDFGQAWDRNLTDEDGPYIELMTGVYTDNQPDFTWLEPGEEKEFVQNFLPYSKLGTVHNATTRAAIKCERAAENSPVLNLGVYSIEAVKGQALLRTEQGRELDRHAIDLTPCHAECYQVKLSDADAKERLIFTLVDDQGHEIVSYLEHIALPTPLPELAKNPPFPADITSTDEAYFIGQHLEQYHHATRNSYDYYQRGLELDPLDYRCNVALGSYEYNRCNYEQALKCADQALSRAHMLNRNTADGTGSLLRANCLLKLGRISEAYDEYFRATWAYNGRTRGYIGLATVSCRKHDYQQACYFAERALQTESTNQEALALKAYAAAEGGCCKATDTINEVIEQYPLNPLYRYFKAHYTAGTAAELEFALNRREINWITIMEFLLKVERTDLLVAFLKQYRPTGAIANLIFASLLNDDSDQELRTELCAQAERDFADFVRFPNLVCERDLLSSPVLAHNAFALHLCASFDYSHRLYERAAALWEQCLKLNPDHVEALRGLGIYEYNKCHNKNRALELFAAAVKASHGDERILFENDLLLKLTGHTPEERLALLEQYSARNCVRDDLKAEMVTLYNQTGRIADAHDMLQNLNFHVWEGGEGRVTGQFINNALLRANETAQSGDYAQAFKIVESALTFPHNLGEGKLCLQTDNDLCFFAACYAHKAGMTEQAQHYLDLARRGDTAITEQQYYNDFPCDYVFYHALADRMAGNTADAEAVFLKMKQWSYEAWDQKVVEDFFAVSLPDLVVLDRNLEQDRHCNCLLMRLLAAIGLNDHKLQEETFAAFNALQPSNFKIALYSHLAPALNQLNAQGHF